MIWQQWLSGFREKRNQRKAARAIARARERELAKAIDHVVDEIDPRIRAVSGYRRKLRPAVERSVDYCAELVSRLPAGIEVSGICWARNHVVKALFSSVGDLRRVFSRSREVQDFFAGHAAADHCYALLSMERRERTVLGMEIHGEMLKRDVRQIAVSFADHRIVTPSLTEAELRKRLEHRAFDNLVSYALEKITTLIAARNSLEEQRHLLEMQAKVSQLRRKGLVPPEGDQDSATPDRATLLEQEARTGKSLAEARARLTTLEDYIDRINEVLGAPQQHLRLDCIAMHLNEMNIRLEGEASNGTPALELSEASLGERLKRTLLIARFPRDDLLPRQEFLASTSRPPRRH